MSYFSPREGSIPTVVEVTLQGSLLRVDLKTDSGRIALHGVVDLRFAVGDEVPNWRRDIRCRGWSLVPTFNVFDGVDDD